MLATTSCLSRATGNHFLGSGAAGKIVRDSHGIAPILGKCGVVYGKFPHQKQATMEAELEEAFSSTPIFPLLGKWSLHNLSVNEVFTIIRPLSRIKRHVFERHPTTDDGYLIRIFCCTHNRRLRSETGRRCRTESGRWLSKSSIRTIHFLARFCSKYHSQSHWHG